MAEQESGRRRFFIALGGAGALVLIAYALGFITAAPGALLSNIVLAAAVVGVAVGDRLAHSREMIDPPPSTDVNSALGRRLRRYFTRGIWTSIVGIVAAVVVLEHVASGTTTFASIPMGTAAVVFGGGGLWLVAWTFRRLQNLSR